MWLRGLFLGKDPGTSEVYTHGQTMCCALIQSMCQSGWGLFCTSKSVSILRMDSHTHTSVDQKEALNCVLCWGFVESQQWLAFCGLDGQHTASPHCTYSWVIIALLSNISFLFYTLCVCVRIIYSVLCVFASKVAKNNMAGFGVVTIR